MILPHYIYIAVAGLIPMFAITDSNDLSPTVRRDYDIVSQTFKESLNETNRPISKLGENYKAAVEKRKSSAQNAGDLQGVINATAALKSFEEGKPPAVDSPDSELNKINKVYLAERSKLDASLRPKQLAVWSNHRKAVEAFIKQLTMEAEIDEAKIVSQELKSIDSAIENLSQKTDGGEEKFIAQSWIGSWKVDFDNDSTRLMEITAAAPEELKIEAISGFYATGEKYSAKWDNERSCFVAVRGAGDAARTESFTLRKNQILIRHWWGKFTYEKPEVKGVARKTKE